MDNYKKVQSINPAYDIQLPMEALNCVDNGQSPDMFLQQMISNAEHTSNLAAGKLKAISLLKDTIEEEIASMMKDQK